MERQDLTRCAARAVREMADAATLKVRRNPPEAADTDAPPEPAPIRVLWFDTEQSEQSTQDILKNRLTRTATRVGGLARS